MAPFRVKQFYWVTLTKSITNNLNIRQNNKTQKIKKHRYIRRWATRFQNWIETMSSRKVRSSCFLLDTCHVTHIVKSCRTPQYEIKQKYKEDVVLIQTTGCKDQPNKNTLLPLISVSGHGYVLGVSISVSSHEYVC